MSGSEKKMSDKTYDIPCIKRVTKKFLEVSRCSRGKQRQRNVQKKVCCTCKVALLLIRPIVVFTVLGGVAFAAQHHTISYFVSTPNKYYRELRFQPWLNPYITVIAPAGISPRRPEVLNWFLYLLLSYYYDPGMYIFCWSSNFVKKVELNESIATKMASRVSYPVYYYCIQSEFEQITANYHETSLEQ